MRTKTNLSAIFSMMLLIAIMCMTAVSCSKSGSSSTPTPTPTPTGGNNAAISIAGMAFPTSTTVTIGTIVSWTNNDGTTHTVTSNDGTSFNSGNLAAGGVFHYTASKAGSYPYHCNIHSSMTSTLIVNP